MAAGAAMAVRVHIPQQLEALVIPFHIGQPVISLVLVPTEPVTTVSAPVKIMKALKDVTKQFQPPMVVTAM